MSSITGNSSKQSFTATVATFILMATISGNTVAARDTINCTAGESLFAISEASAKAMIKTTGMSTTTGTSN